MISKVKNDIDGMDQMLGSALKPIPVDERCWRILSRNND